MKKIILLFFVYLLTSQLGFTQVLDNLDYVSPLNEGLIAIKKENKWAFIDELGNFKVDFRDDLVLTKTKNNSYPIFKNSRCLISQVKEGITYFGYIDKSGKTIIKPQYLNALNFKNEVAIVLELVKETAGKNELLDKNIVYYKYYEVIIDSFGNVQNYLTNEGTHITLDKRYLKVPPKITSKLITNNLYTIKNKNTKWDIKKIKN